ncbi:MAG: hypothetical protein LRY50_10610 [Geovibrio sp.]|nr:hypothetical protein [Geovibrio sp.]
MMTINPKGIRINNRPNLSEEDVNKILIVKNGLEDLNLIIQEIEHTYQILGSEENNRERKGTEQKEGLRRWKNSWQI